MELSVLIAGFGGQGVLSIGKLLCYAADADGKKATFFPTYGGEQRGGTANCTVILSDEEIASPVVKLADIVIVMNEPSFEKFKNRVKPKGLLIINTSSVKNKIEREDINILEIQADEIAAAAGNPKASNMVVLGAFTKAVPFIEKERLKTVIKEQMAHKPEHMEANLRAFERAALS